MPSCVIQFIYESRCCLAAMLARYRLHKIRYLDQEGHAVVAKSRRAYGRIAIKLGNLYLRLQKCDVEILKTDEWIRWEKAVQNARNVADCIQQTELFAEGKHTFTRPYVSGTSLRDLLNDDRYPEEQKFTAVEWGVDSLCQLHQLQADWGRGLIQSVSHGDATVNNVIVDVERQQATWIDFDIRHLSVLSELDRQTDDIRALVFSAAFYLPVTSFPQLAEIIKASLTNRGLLFRFRERLANEWTQRNTFQMAQAPLPWSAKNLLTNLLLNPSAGGPLIFASAAVKADQRGGTRDGEAAAVGH